MPTHTPSPSTQFVGDQTRRRTSRNRTLADQADAVTTDPFLPTLDAGVTLLDRANRRGVPLVQSLVLDHLLLHDGPAFWVDANGHARTTTLAQIAPSQRLLDRIHVARGFTAYQHYSAVCDLSTAVPQPMRDSTADTPRDRPPSGDDIAAHTPSLIVAPAVDAQYRDDDTLSMAHAETLQARTLARLATYADEYDAPVLVTRRERDDFTRPVATAADHHLECEHTRMGPRFVGDEFETCLYPVEGGAYHQTTFAYWRHVLRARATQVGVKPASPSATARPSDVGTGVMADGETTSLAASPLLDTWTAAKTGGR